MTNLQLYFQGLLKFISYWWPVMLFGTCQLINLWRWEKREKKRIAQAHRRDNLKESIIKNILLSGSKS